MPTLLIRHRVEDYVTWKVAFDQHASTRRANGSRGGHLFRNAAEPNDVVILLAWHGLERARLFVDSDDLRETMMRAGVAGYPEIWFLEDLECLAV